jgi:hypothetical protein
VGASIQGARSWGSWSRLLAPLGCMTGPLWATLPYRRQGPLSVTAALLHLVITQTGVLHQSPGTPSAMAGLIALSTSGSRLDGKRLHLGYPQPHLRARCNSALAVILLGLLGPVPGWMWCRACLAG